MGIVRRYVDIARLPKNAYLPVGAIVVLSLLPIGLGSNLRIMNILILCFIWSMVSTSWDLLMGYAGVWSFGQLAMFTIGGYTSGILTVHFGISPWLGMAAGAGAAALTGVFMCLLCLRLRGMFLALVSFAIHLVLTPILNYATPITGGTMGFSIPRFQIGEYVFSYFNMVPYYYVGLGLFLGVSYLIYRIIHSSIGLALVSLGDSEVFTKCLGVNDYKSKFTLFAISSSIAGLAGAFYAHYQAVMAPTILGLTTFLQVLMMMVIGGLGRFPGAIIGAFTITALVEGLRPIGTLRFVALGAIIVGTMIYMPGGLMGIPESLNRLIKRSKLRRRK